MNFHYNRWNLLPCVKLVTHSLSLSHFFYEWVEIRIELLQFAHLRNENFVRFWWSTLSLSYIHEYDNKKWAPRPQPLLPDWGRWSNKSGFDVSQFIIFFHGKNVLPLMEQLAVFTIQLRLKWLSFAHETPLSVWFLAFDFDCHLVPIIDHVAGLCRISQLDDVEKND